MAAVQNPQQKSIIEIYTDWANHYLDKLKGRQRIKDLQTELRDGLVLSDVIEAVTSSRVPEIVRKPKTPAQMTHNLQQCLNFLLSRGVAVEEITAKEVHEGNLKAILGLFFQLSRYKQQQKQQMMQLQQLKAAAASGGIAGARSATPKIPSVPPSPARQPGPQSAIPSPKKAMTSSPAASSKPARQSGLKAPSAAAAVASPKKNVTGIPSPPQQKTSMLDKLKLMRSSNGQPKQGAAGQTQQQQQLAGPSSGIKYQYREKGLGKRTSSSSGFSSARSVGSESSVSVSSDTNFPSPSALRRINENSTFNSTPSPQKPKGGVPSPRRQPPPPTRQLQPPQSIRKHSLPTAGQTANPRGSTQSLVQQSRQSPKRSPKLVRANTEIKDYGPIDGQHQPGGVYPPHSGKSSFGLISRLPQHASNVRSPPSSQTGLPVAKGGRIQPPPNSSMRAPVASNKQAADHQQKGGDAKLLKRREDSSPTPASNVAVVSPMPSLKKQKAQPQQAQKAAGGEESNQKPHPAVASKQSSCEDGEPGESALKSLVPMQPLFGADNKATAAIEVNNVTLNQSGE